MAAGSPETIWANSNTLVAGASLVTTATNLVAADTVETLCPAAATTTDDKKDSAAFLKGAALAASIAMVAATL